MKNVKTTNNDPQEECEDTKGVIRSRTSKKLIIQWSNEKCQNDKQWSTRRVWRYQRCNQDESVHRRRAGCRVFCTFYFSLGHWVDLSFFYLRLLIAPLVFLNCFSDMKSNSESQCKCLNSIKMLIIRIWQIEWFVQ